jgi:hypothetical protein
MRKEQKVLNSQECGAKDPDTNRASPIRERPGKIKLPAVHRMEAAQLP